MSQENSSQEKTNRESILEQFDNGTKDTLVVGIAPDSYPISYFQDGRAYGFCKNFVENILVDSLNKKYRRTGIKITAEYKDVRKEKIGRFDLLRDQSIDIECGPNTIPNNTDNKRHANISFSKPFFKTGTRILIKRENQKTVEEKPDFEGLSIGLIKDTTTISFVKLLFPLATTIHDNLETRAGGIDLLKKGNITGFATDSVLLEGELERKTRIENPNDYYLYPKYNLLNSEPYGLAFHDTQTEWHDYVNDLIDGDKAQDEIQKQLGKYQIGKYQSLSFSDNAKKIEELSLDRERKIAQLSLDLDHEKKRAQLFFISCIVIVIIVISILGCYAYSRAKIVKISFDQSEDFNWQAFIYCFKKVEENYQKKVVLLGMNQLSIEKNSNVYFQINSKGDLTKKDFEQNFRSNYQEALKELKNQNIPGLINVDLEHIPQNKLTQFIYQLSVHFENLFKSSQEGQMKTTSLNVKSNGDKNTITPIIGKDNTNNIEQNSEFNESEQKP
ncbi:hypothetical protein CYANOKiyG1_20530 [Okeania sp. KiyG1]|nr:hypothetical protein CYANOKiyG1_20530 [Okeania sp. KiyG1]